VKAANVRWCYALHRCCQGGNRCDGVPFAHHRIPSQRASEHAQREHPAVSRHPITTLADTDTDTTTRTAALAVPLKLGRGFGERASESVACCLVSLWCLMDDGSFGRGRMHGLGYFWIALDA
jgi:hypothetical protein